MGGRMASLMADRFHTSDVVQGCVALGYPFHPIGKSDRLRTDHLLQLQCPMLIVQGERDAMGGVHGRGARSVPADSDSVGNGW